MGYFLLDLFVRLTWRLSMVLFTLRLLLARVGLSVWLIGVLDCTDVLLLGLRLNF